MQAMGSGAPASVAERAKAILSTPKTEWPVIAAEPATIGDLYRNYVLILAAIPAVCGAIGGAAWGHSLLGVTYRPSILSAATGAIVSYLLTLIGVYLLALVIDALAPRFGGTRNRVQAFKLAAYSGTAAWVAGLFQLIPGLGWLGILGLYGLYLLYLGLPFLMRAPAANALSYTAVTVVAALVLSLLVGILTAPLVALVSPAATITGSADSGTVSGTLSVPGVGAVDLGKLEAATKQMEAATRTDGTARPALAAGALEGLLPDTLDGLPRAEISSSSAAAGGLGGSRAEAVYRAGERRITLGITDLGAAGALAALGTAFNVRSSKQTADGYEKIDQIDGRMTAEEWDGTAKRGKYNVLVGSRFMVEAEGEGIAMAALKDGVGRVGFDRLEALAK